MCSDGAHKMDVYEIICEAVTVLINRSVHKLTATFLQMF